MNCPNCGRENQADARFCSNCGHSLVVTCSVCGTVADPGDKFCRECGSSLQGEAEPQTPQDDLSRYIPEELLAKMRSARSGRAMLGERRTVTMLFADVTGSTAAAEKLDPEDWVEIMNGAFECLIAPIYRYEGTLAQLRGDAILAFFGAPIAHEDDPTRALRSGLEMLEAIQVYSRDVESRWGIPLQIRVGINTGLVVVGEIGSDLRVEYTALGDAINVAARMEQTAEPGTVRVTEETLSRTGGVFETEQLGPVAVKGKAEPVISHRVLGYAGGSPETPRRPMVGRDEELAALAGLTAKVEAGSGWVASLIAEAGIGKTRLLEEWRARSRASVAVANNVDQAGDILWVSTASRSYDTHAARSTVRSLLRRLWGAGDTVPSFAVVESAVHAVGIDDPDVAALLGFLADAELSPSAEGFISALETPVLNARAPEAFHSYLTRLAEQRPAVLVFEDVHWADDISLALIEDLMSIVETQPLGLVFAMRPYREDSAWRIHEVAGRDHHHRYHSFELEPLGTEQSGALLDSLAADRPLDEEERQRLLERSAGNPLFIEEIAKSLGESDPSTLPSSLVGALTARLDRLDEEAKYTVQMASVLGTEFDLDTLSSVLGPEASQPPIVDLLRQGILAESAEEPGTYLFRHALFQEAAYETILKRTRRDLHRRVAEHLIDAHPGEHLQISTHLVQAGAETEAFPHLVEAGLEASRSMSLGEAIRLLTLALDNIPDDADPEAVEKAHDALGDAYSMVPDLSHASAAYQRLYEYGESVDRPAARVTALNRLGWTTAALGADLEGATRYLEQARQLAEECGDDVGMAEYHMTSCFVASMAGNTAAAVEHDEKTVEFGEKTGVDVIRVSGMVRRATNYTALLEFEKAAESVERALAETEAAGQEEAHAVVEAFGVGMERFLRGDLDTAQELLERADRTLERYSSFYWAANQQSLAVLLLQRGDLEGALGRFVDCKRVAERLHQPFVGATGSSGLALVYAELGFVDPIAELRAEALASFQGPMSEFMASTVWADLGMTSLLLGDVVSAGEEFATGLSASSTTQHLERPRLLLGQALVGLHSGDPEAAESSLTEARAIIEDRDLELYRASLGHVHGLLAEAAGEVETAETRLREAHRHAMEVGQRLVIARILQARSRLADTREAPEEAKDLARQAAEAVDTVASTILDESLRASFVASEKRRAAIAP